MSKGNRNRSRKFDTAVKKQTATDLKAYDDYIQYAMTTSPAIPYNEDIPCCTFCHNTEGPHGNMAYTTDIGSTYLRWCVTHQGAKPLHKFDCTSIIRGLVIKQTRTGRMTSLTVGPGSYDAAIMGNL